MLGYAAALKYLHAKKEEDRSFIYAMARGAREVQRKHDHERANQIAHEVLSNIKIS